MNNRFARTLFSVIEAQPTKASGCQYKLLSFHVWFQSAGDLFALSFTRPTPGVGLPVVKQTKSSRDSTMKTHKTLHDSTINKPPTRRLIHPRLFAINFIDEFKYNNRRMSIDVNLRGESHFVAHTKLKLIYFFVPSRVYQRGGWFNFQIAQSTVGKYRRLTWLSSSSLLRFLQLKHLLLIAVPFACMTCVATFYVFPFIDCVKGANLQGACYQVNANNSLL